MSRIVARWFVVFLALVPALVLAVAQPARAWRPFEFVNPQELEIRITPERRELTAGDTATFTISVRNKTDKPVKLSFDTGQRWDMAAFHNRTQIWRWSQGLRWYEAPHTLTLMPDKPETYSLSWTTRDRLGVPLPQGIYSVQGMVMVRPRHFVTNLTDIRLLPPKDKAREVIKVPLGGVFEIQVPTWQSGYEMTWRIEYDYNDNRITQIQSLGDLQTTTLRFSADRLGHVTMRLFGHSAFKDETLSLERRTYRIEVVPRDD